MYRKQLAVLTTLPLLLLMTLLNSSSLFREHFLILVEGLWLLPDLNGEFCNLCQERKSCLCGMQNRIQKTSRSHFCLKAVCWHCGEVHLQVGNPCVWWWLLSISSSSSSQERLFPELMPEQRPKQDPCFFGLKFACFLSKCHILHL